jgi:hypothetical protein
MRRRRWTTKRKWKRRQVRRWTMGRTHIHAGVGWISSPVLVRIGRREIIGISVGTIIGELLTWSRDR